MATVTVPNVTKDKDTGAMTTAPVTASKAPASASLAVIIPSMIALLAAIIGMWYADKHVIMPAAVGFAKSYVPYAGVVAATAALERFLEPLSQIFMQGTVKADVKQDDGQKGAAGAKETTRPEPVSGWMQKILRLGADRETSAKKTLKQAAAESRSRAQKAAADPDETAADIQPLVDLAAADQASLDTLRTNRAVFFWALASICGVGISGGFGLFLLQSIATSHVNSFLDLAVTGLTIGAGTKPTHDLITSLQAKSGGPS